LKPIDRLLHETAIRAMQMFINVYKKWLEERSKDDAAEKLTKDDPNKLSH
jgi:hypothetical protein